MRTYLRESSRRSALRRSLVLLPLLVACSTAAESTRSAPASQSQSESASGELAVGSMAPDFDMTDQDGKRVQLSSLRGKHVVLYFYPKDETPGCTAEAQAFRDAHEALTKSGAVIIGVSTDDDASHRAFAQSHALPFTLLSDASGALAAKYGVPLTFGFAKRQTFVIAPDGTLKKIYRDVDVDGHAAQIVTDVR